MKKSTADILEEIRIERERQSALTRCDLEREYRELIESGFDIGKQLSFESDLAGSEQIEFHYEMILKDWKRDKKCRLNIDDSFKKRGKQGRAFLFSLLENKDEFESVHIARLIASCFSGYPVTGEILDEQNRLIPYLLRYAESDTPEYRRSAIIALGWVFTPEQLEKELDCILDHLQNDEDSLCRAWSSSALMQLYFHGASAETIRARAQAAIIERLRAETDIFVTGVIIETVGELWDKNFRLSSAAVEKKDSERVEKARRSAIRFFERNSQ